MGGRVAASRRVVATSTRRKRIEGGSVMTVGW